jgi:hypothetical protein
MQSKAMEEAPRPPLQHGDEDRQLTGIGFDDLLRIIPDR